MKITGVGGPAGHDGGGGPAGAGPAPGAGPDAGGPHPGGQRRRSTTSTALVAPLLAEHLGMPFLGIVTGVEAPGGAGTVTVTKEFPSSVRGEFERPLPGGAGHSGGGEAAALRAGGEGPGDDEVGQDRDGRRRARRRGRRRSRCSQMTKPVTAGHAEMLEGTPEEVAATRLRDSGRSRPAVRRTRPWHGNVWVLAEQWRGQLSDITYELLALGRELADGLGVPLEAVLLGSTARATWRRAGRGGRGALRRSSRPGRAEPRGVRRRRWRQMVAERKPRAVLVPLTQRDLGRGHSPGPAGRAARQLLQDVRVEGGALRATAWSTAARWRRRSRSPARRRSSASGPASRTGEQARVDRRPRGAGRRGGAPAEAPRVRFGRYVEPEAGDVDITQQDVLVAVGRGIQNKDNIELAEELAAGAGWARCAVAAGDRPGLAAALPAGRQVRGDGEAQAVRRRGHQRRARARGGNEGRGLIIAVNTDPQAPIFDVAHYGVVGRRARFPPGADRSRAGEERLRPACPIQA